MSNAKTVQLERTSPDSEGQLGSFGFSILGGHGTKFPACVCEVDQGGPADQTKEVHVGDRLLELNGEVLQLLTPRDLVLRIRHAPSPSSLTLSEDEDLRSAVMAFLRKKERRLAERARRDRITSTGSDGSAASLEVTSTKSRKLTPPTTLVEGSVEEKRKKRLDKIIEVEPSVNTPNGNTSSRIVRVRDNKIVGQVDGSHETLPNSSPRKSPSRSRTSPSRHSPSRSGASPQRKSSQQELATTEEREGSLSPNITDSKNSLPSPNNISLDSLSIQSNGSGAGSHHGSSSRDHTPEHTLMVISSKGSDGVEVKVLSDSSGVNSSDETTPLTGSITSFEEKSSKVELHPLTEEREGGESSVSISTQEANGQVAVISDGSSEYDSGVALQIPSWNGHALQTRMGAQPRASLSEDIFIEELERKGMAMEDSVAANGEQEEVRSSEDPATSEGGKIPRRRSSCKKRDNAVTLARKLFMLDGYKKSEVAAKLADKSEYGQILAKEYLKFFEFENQPLDDSLRQFLACFSLTGESQERERVMVHFSERYHECTNQFDSADTVHGITVAVLLLNTDLHNDHGGRKMTVSQFGTNLERIGVKISKDLIKSLYESVRKNPLEWAVDDDDSVSNSHDLLTVKTSMNSNATTEEDTERVYHVTIPGTFVEVEMRESTPLFKEGYVLKKNVMEGPHKKVHRGKRQWKPYYAYLKGFLLYLEPPRGGDLRLEDTSSAISICHCLAMGAHDYHKKNSVLRVTTSEWQSFLLQANDTMDMQQWISAINRAASLYSSPPLAAPTSSSSVFQKPTYPMAPTKNDRKQQEDAHESKVKSLTSELEEHQAYKPKGSKAKHTDLKNWFDKYEFIQFEVNRFHIYFALMSNDGMVDFSAPLPSGLVPSPSVSTLATSSTSDSRNELSWASLTPPHSPSRKNKSSRLKIGSNSPLLSSRAHHS